MQPTQGILLRVVYEFKKTLKEDDFQIVKDKFLDGSVRPVFLPNPTQEPLTRQVLVPLPSFSFRSRTEPLARQTLHLDPLCLGRECNLRLPRFAYFVLQYKRFYILSYLLFSGDCVKVEIRNLNKLCINKVWTVHTIPQFIYTRDGRTSNIRSPVNVQGFKL